MQFFSYRAVFEPNGGVVVVHFPDVPEAITQGDDMADAKVQAADALGLALLTYAEMGRPFPTGTVLEGLDVVTVEPDVAAKLALLSAFKTSDISKSELARRLGKDEKEVRRLLDPMHPSKIKPLREALAQLGRRLVVGVDEAAESATADARAA